MCSLFLVHFSFYCSWIPLRNVRNKCQHVHTMQSGHGLVFRLFVHYWASEANHTLGCSIEILCDICRYVGMSVCLQKYMYAKTCGRNYAAETQAFSKSVLGG